MTSLDPVMTVGAQIEEMIALHADMSHSGIRERAQDMLRLSVSKSKDSTIIRISLVVG